MQKKISLCVTTAINLLINACYQFNLHKNLALNTSVFNVLADNLFTLNWSQGSVINPGNNHISHLVDNSDVTFAF